MDAVYTSLGSGETGEPKRLRDTATWRSTRSAGPALRPCGSSRRHAFSRHVIGQRVVSRHTFGAGVFCIWESPQRVWLAKWLNEKGGTAARLESEPCATSVAAAFSPGKLASALCAVAIPVETVKTRPGRTAPARAVCRGSLTGRSACVTTGRFVFTLAFSLITGPQCSDIV